MTIPDSYKKPLAFAVALHIILAIILVVKLPSWGYRYQSGHGPHKIVQATAVSSQSVEKAMRQIQYREQARQRAEEQHLAALKRQAQREKAQQRAAAVRVAKMQQEQLRLKQQHAAQVKALAALKHKQEHLAKLAKQRAAKARARALAAEKHRQQLLAAKQHALQQKLMMQQLAGDSKQLQQVQVNQINGIVNKYAALMQAAIGQRWLVPGGADKSLAATYDIQLAPDGTVISATLIKSSGNSALDQSAKTAIYKASPLPVPKEAAAFDKLREIHLTLSPKNLIHS